MKEKKHSHVVSQPVVNFFVVTVDDDNDNNNKNTKDDVSTNTLLFNISRTGINSLNSTSTHTN